MKREQCSHLNGILIEFLAFCARLELTFARSEPGKRLLLVHQHRYGLI
jgi:hypothetical protein